VTFTTSSTAGAVSIGLKATDAKGLSNSTTGALTVQAPPAPKDEGCSSTGSPASAMGLLVVGAFLLLRRRARA
jgi:MYXO-CTERM domain-containing protein